MGWTFSRSFTKASIRAERTAPYQDAFDRGSTTTTLRSTYKGNTLWTLHETTTATGEMQRWIGCTRVSRQDGQWGYKDMSEHMGPYYFDCPLDYLDAATEPPNETASEWREQVRRHHAQKKLQAAKKPQVGETWSVVGSPTVPRISVVDTKPLIGTYNGTLYRVKQRMLGERIYG